MQCVLCFLNLGSMQCVQPQDVFVRLAGVERGVVSPSVITVTRVHVSSLISYYLNMYLCEKL